METVLIAIGTLVPMLLILVVIHEFGHYATARAMGVKVLEFGVGFPPRAFGIYTGNTKVLIDLHTRFVNLQGPGDLRLGQVIKVYSNEDSAGNLVAQVIEAPRSKRRSRDQDSNSGELPIPDGLLKHDGKVKAVEPGGGSMILADMLYSVNWAPLGGFVRLAGESNPDVPRSLASKGTGTRTLVLVAGPLMNAILPIVVFAILFMIPRDVTIGQVLISEVGADTAGAAAGLQPGDIVVEADGEQIENRFDLDRSIFLNGGSTMEWLIVREGVEQVIPVKPRFERPPGRWVAGIGISEIEGRVVLQRVEPDSPAEVAGLQPEDIVLRVGGQEILQLNDLRSAIQASQDSETEWLILREGREQLIRVTPRFDQSGSRRWLTGISTTFSRVVLQRVESDSLAEVAGLQPEDIVLRVGDQEILQLNDLRSAIQASQDSETEWLILREGREQLIRVTPRFDQSGSRRWLIDIGIVETGVDTRVESRSDPIWEAIPQGFVSTWESLLLMKQAISGSVSEGSAPEFSGPIGIAQLTGEVTQDLGFTGWLTIAVLLSINLAILNILPIPMLDGGRLVFVILEWARRGKRVPPEKEGLVHLIGFVLLISAVLVISANDISRLINGGSLLG